MDVFADVKPSSRQASTKAALLSLKSALDAARLQNSALGPMTLPQHLDPAKPVALPNRLSTLFRLVRDSVTALVRLPFFAFPLFVHLPVYVAGKLALSVFDPEEEESFARQYCSDRYANSVADDARRQKTRSSSVCSFLSSPTQPCSSLLGFSSF